MLDVHTHFIAPDLEPPSQAAADQGWPIVEPYDDRIEVYQRAKLVRVLDASAYDARHRIRAMDDLGVDQQVLMPTPFTFLYDADPQLAIEYAKAQNDRLTELVSAGNGRFYGFGALPLQDPDASVVEARRIHNALGLSGVEIGTHAHRYELHDPALDPVFAELEQLGSAVFVHPWQPIPRATHHGLAFGLGRPIETELAVGSLVFGGCLERHPKLRVCLAHGGGGVPALLGRLHNGWSRLDSLSREPVADPRDLVGQLWADGLTYDAGALALAEVVFGPDRMVVGSDFPFAAQESPIARTYAAATKQGIITADWIDRTTRNALSFLGVSPCTRHIRSSSTLESDTSGAKS